jgi:uncharacterized protein (TIGR01777 family)
MRILLTGSNGLIGRKLLLFLGDGFEVLKLRYTEQPKDGLFWNPEHRIFPSQEALGRIDAVCHLAGENIASGRWSKEKKRKILRSRELGTKFIVERTLCLNPKPRVFISASAVGYYGNKGSLKVYEDAACGPGFLAQVCAQWEAALRPLCGHCRSVSLRFGMVLSREGGALAKMFPLFKLGLGGPLGRGNQFVSWVSLLDALSAIRFALQQDSLEGAVNVCSPFPVTNDEFTQILARSLNRPARIRVPASILRLFLGEMSQELLLNSVRAQPGKLLEHGFAFEHPRLEDALTKGGLLSTLEPSDLVK